MDVDRLGIGFLGGFGLPPVEFVNLTADLGCRHMSAVVQGGPLVPLGYPPFSLKDDAAHRRDMLAAMNHRGVTISLGDGFLVLPGADISRCATDLDVLAELGGSRINVVSLDPDLGRTFDQFAMLTDLAAQRGLMHLVRSGSGAADVVAIDPGGIGYAQLNDTTLRPRIDNYMEEAMFERLVPGEGELPLHDILSALPADIVIELEVPRRSLALAGVSPIDRLRPCVEAARRLLSGVDSVRRPPA